MRAVIQRVAQASVTIDGAVCGAIERGLLVLLGVEEVDSEADVDWLVGKIARMRIFPDANGKMNCDVNQVGGRVLVVSQFTLFASTKKGNRPAFTRAAAPERAVPLYQAFCRQLEAVLGTEVATGRFGADMAVALVNDGPVTITVDTHHRE